MFTPALALALCTLAAHPAEVRLASAHDARQLRVTRGPAGRDVTHAARYSIDADIATVDASGLVRAKKAGRATVRVEVGGAITYVPVAVESDEAAEWSFARQITPILSRAGCNGGGCHGKIAGQNGFRLSLFGADPVLDYATIAKESRGRRLNPSAPAESLFLTKAAGKVPHGGGRKLDPASDDALTLLRWVEAGAPFGPSEPPALVKLTAGPGVLTLAPGADAQLAVAAEYADGARLDAAPQAQYESNRPDVAEVRPGGRLHSAGKPGVAAIMVRFGGRAAVARVVVPRPGPGATAELAGATEIDRPLIDHWKRLNLAPAARCTDAAYLRRATVDITGALPTAAAAEAFAADASPDKRARLVEKLLLSPGYADRFTALWADLLRVRRGPSGDHQAEAAAFHDWLRHAVETDRPFDLVVRQLLGATGSEASRPAVAWSRQLNTPERFADDVSQVWMGTRLSCANCHHHPYEKWDRDDYWDFAAISGRVQWKFPVPGGGRRSLGTLALKPGGAVNNPRTGRPATPRPPGGSPLESASDPDADLRPEFAQWLTAGHDRTFAKVVVNRYWAQFFGAGIVEPVDDFRDTNPPSQPELLDALAEAFVRERHSLKSLVRVIASSEAYQRSSDPVPNQEGDQAAFARFAPRRLPAESLADAVATVVGRRPERPRDRYAPRTELAQADAASASELATLAGKPERLSACACERTADSRLALHLHLLNNPSLELDLAKPSATAARLARDPRPAGAKVRELFVLATGEPPSADQLDAALEAVSAGESGWRNLVWALVNSPAFLFVR